MNAVKNRRTMADTLLHPCGSYAPCRRVEGSRVRFLYLDSSRPATRLQEHRAYPELFALLGGQVPDMRGLFLRGYGSQAHVQNNGTIVGITSTMHSSGALGQVQGDGTRNVTGTIGPSIDAGSSGIVYRNGQSGYMLPSAAHYATAFHHIDISRVVPTANENRPVNTAVPGLVRARP